MKYLIDANICIRLLGSGSEGLKERVRERDAGDIGISAIAFAEVALGSRNGKAPSLAVLDHFRSQIPVLPFDELAAKKYAELPFSRGSYDRLIAAHALALDLILVTDNERHFSTISNLRVENWVAA